MNKNQWWSGLELRFTFSAEVRASHFWAPKGWGRRSLPPWRIGRAPRWKKPCHRSISGRAKLNETFMMPVVGRQISWSIRSKNIQKTCCWPDLILFGPKNRAQKRFRWIVPSWTSTAMSTSKWWNASEISMALSQWSCRQTGCSPCCRTSATGFYRSFNDNLDVVVAVRLVLRLFHQVSQSFCIRLNLWTEPRWARASARG